MNETIYPVLQSSHELASERRNRLGTSKMYLSLFLFSPVLEYAHASMLQVYQSMYNTAEYSLYSI